MRRASRLPELLAPAGDFDCLVAAVRAGADAVYVGGKLYSARAYAKNFDIPELRRAVAYCHLHGVRLYVTLNILLHEGEIEPALGFARELYLLGVDALIVADVGLIRAIRQVLPELELHASTQMSVHNSLGADVAHSLGCTRVVLARELSGEDIRRVTEVSKPETEVFIHGALCVSHSGQCLFSSMVGGRSGNRGECAQPCRLPYCGGKYPLSLSDLSLAHHIPELIASGTASLKIEGRMKAPGYVYTVTSVYRRLLDECRTPTQSEDELLRRAFSRGGFTDGYFTGKHNKKMTGVRSEADKKESLELSDGDYTPDRVKIRAEVRIKRGECAEMTLYRQGKSRCDALAPRCVTVRGAVPREAISSPLDKDGVTARLSKFGSTFLSLERGDISLTLDEGINLSPGELNSLRRLAAEALEHPTRSATEGPLSPPNDVAPATDLYRTAIFYRATELDMIGSERNYFDAVFLPISELSDTSFANGVALPPVIMESELSEVRGILSRLAERGIKYALVCNIGGIMLAKAAGLLPVADFRLNVYNRYTRDTYSELGLDVPMISPELTLGEADAVGGREIVYGRIPLMLTERCFISENFGCKSCGRAELTDRRGVRFPMLREWRHRNIIFNSAVTYLLDKPSSRARFAGEHYIFSTESHSEIKAVIAAARVGGAFPLDAPMRRIGKRRPE